MIETRLRGLDSLHRFSSRTDGENASPGILNSRILNNNQISCVRAGLDADGGFLGYKGRYGADNPDTAIVSDENACGFDVRMVDSALIRSNIEVRCTPVYQYQQRGFEETTPVQAGAAAAALLGAG